MFLLVLLRSAVEPKIVLQPTIYKELPINLDELREYQENTASPIGEWELVYSPQNKYLHEIVSAASRTLGLTKDVVPIKNAVNLQAYMQNKTKPSLVAIQFNNNLINLSSYPKNLVYTIRFPSELRHTSLPIVSNWLTNFFYPMFDYGGPRNSEYDNGGKPGYIEEGFLAIQNAIALEFIKSLATQSSIEKNFPEIVVRRTPYPPYTYDSLLLPLEQVISVVVVLGFVYPASQTVKAIALEKEMQLKETMKIMGLPNWLHWLSWFTRSIIIMFLSIIIVVTLLKLPVLSKTKMSIITKSSFGCIVLIYVIYCTALITFCFFLSTLFSKANSATAITGFVLFIVFLPYQLTFMNYSDISLTYKISVCLLTNAAVGFAFKLIINLEGIGGGLHWSNIFKPIRSDDSLSIGIIMIMMLISSLIHMILTLYIERLRPGKYGVPEKWYFPFTKKFWMGEKEIKILEQLPSISARDSRYSTSSSHHSHHQFLNKHIGISIRGLHKTFDNKIAVNNLFLNLHENEITVLLGHNGAGKTTTISMLTGIIPPTSGTAIINGYDIKKNLKEARKSMGLCPQHNILFDELTVREHILFYSRLKGMEKNKLENEVEKYIGILQLEPKINTQSRNLSGGMKRKLSVGSALCGGSKVIFFDEPSAGMDPAARRAFWDILAIEKKGRTILLSTHFMDEADVLGDRIAIMSAGELICYGTPFFLKKKYGVGYHLVCVKKEACDPQRTTDLINKYIPDIQIESNIGTELSYQLPDDYCNIFQPLLEELENSLDDLNLDGYGINITNMEEVFMKVGIERTNPTGSFQPFKNQETNSLGLCDNLNSNDGKNLIVKQLKAMFLKKFLVTFRNIFLFFMQNFIPILLVVLTILISRNVDNLKTLMPLKITINSYECSTTLIEINDNVGDFEKDIFVQYKNYIKSFDPKHKVISITTDIIPYYLQLTKEDIVKVNGEYLIAATITNNKIVAWFNNQLLHTAPLSLNVIHNSILRAIFPSDSSYYIDVTNFPLPFLEQTRLSFLNDGSDIGFHMANNITLGMTFVTAIYVVNVIREQESGSKLIQFVSGVRVWIFWISHLIFDQITLWITALLTVITLAYYQEIGFSTFSEIARLFFVMFIFSFAVMPCTYILSAFFHDPAGGFARVSIINIFFGLSLFLVVNVMGFSVLDLPELANDLNKIFLIVPHYALARSINNLYVNTIRHRVCTKMCDTEPYNQFPCNLEILCEHTDLCCVPGYFDWKEPGLQKVFFYLLSSSFVFLVILLAREFQLFNKLHKTINSYLKKPKNTTEFYTIRDDPNIDDDVMKERQMIDEFSAKELSSKNLVLNKITKYYSKFLAVNQISLEVKHSECFGLLGVNGAGKTSTFKMLTGNESISSGDAFVKGIDLKVNMNEVYRDIGYCPQFDALFGELTGREHLKIFSLLRGIPEENMNTFFEEMANTLGFTKHIDKLVETYSGGNKRKLSVAVAILGNPSVIYLDEPTTGMDPGARRQLWNVVCQIRNSGKSILLSSHSMEECEALCTRLAIMVNGEFKCIGSTQHLKNKFAKGIILKIKLYKKEFIQSKDEVSNSNSKSSINISKYISSDTTFSEQLIESEFSSLILRQFIEKEFPTAILKERYQTISTYHVPLQEIKWSKIFGVLEENRVNLGIEDYSISQTTLEQIFLQFAKHEDLRENQ